MLSALPPISVMHITDTNVVLQVSQSQMKPTSYGNGKLILNIKHYNSCCFVAIESECTSMILVCIRPSVTARVPFCFCFLLYITLALKSNPLLGVSGQMKTTNIGAVFWCQPDKSLFFPSSYSPAARGGGPAPRGGAPAAADEGHVE